MPNWSMNHLKVKGLPAEMADFYAVALCAQNEFTFANVFPLPTLLKNTISPTASAKNHPEAENSTPEKCARLIEAYGADNWYDWNCATYGSKWDVQDAVTKVQSNVLFECHFKTAWAPPYAFLENLQKKFSNLDLALSYCVENDDENMGLFTTMRNETTGQKTIQHHQTPIVN
jgi:hypothetical protein